MAAVGCGSAAATAVGGPSVTVTTRGRFPGRPWTSRSLLRSEKRPQLGRLGADDGKTGTGGPRPASTGLKPNEDPSLLRLLGIAEHYKRQAEAGYSSSGSEEGEEFRGFEVEDEGNRNSLRSRQDSSRSNPLDLKLSKVAEENPHPALDHAETRTALPVPKKGSKPSQEPRQRTVTDQLQKNGGKSSKNNLSKLTTSTARSQEKQTRPKITLKLVSKKTVKKKVIVSQKPLKKVKVSGYKFLSKGRKLQGIKSSGAQVKLKKGKQDARRKSLKVGGGTSGGSRITRQGRSLAGKVIKAGNDRKQAKSETEGPKVEGKKSLGKHALVPQRGSTTPNADSRKSKCRQKVSEPNTEVNKVKGQRQCKKAVKCETDVNSVAELESQGTEGSLAEPLSKEAATADSTSVVSSKKDNVGRRQQRKQDKQASNIETPLGAEQEKPFDTGSLAFESKSQDFGIPGLKLKRVRNPKAVLASSARSLRSDQDLKALSCKKQSKFVWTLTLVKGKGKAPKRQGPGKMKEENEDVMITDDKKEDEASPTATTPGLNKCTQKQQKTCKRTRGKGKLGPEMGNAMEAQSGETAKEGILVGEVVVPPLKLKVVSSSSEHGSLQPSLLKQIDSDLREKEHVAENVSAIQGDLPTLSTVNSPSSPKAEDRSNLTFPQRKQSCKPLTAQKLKTQNVSAENIPQLPTAQDEAQMGKCPTQDVISEPQQDAEEMGVSRVLSSLKEETCQGSDAFGSQSTEAVANIKPEMEQEVAVPGEGDAPVQPPLKRVRKPFKQKRRKSIFGYRRKPEELPVRPSPRSLGEEPKRHRRKLITFTYEVIPDPLEEAAKAGMGGQSPQVSHDQQQDKFLNEPHSSTAVVSARSSRVIKTPKRFKDYEDSSALSLRMFQKKGHLSLHPRSARKQDFDSEDLFDCLKDDYLPEPLFDFEDADVSQAMSTSCDIKVEEDSATSPNLSGKRKTPLREPNFKWRSLEGAEEEVYTQESPQLSMQDLMSSDSTTTTTSLPPNKVSTLSKGSALNIYEKLKKLTSGTGQKKKVKEGVRTFGSPSDAESRSWEGRAGETQDPSLSLTHIKKKKKAKLKMEDLDSPGVVRKVAVRVRSKPQMSIYGDKAVEGHEEDGNASSSKLTVKIKGEDEALEPSVGEPEEDQKEEREQVVIEEKGTTHRVCLTGANKRMFHLLKRAKVQLIKIDQQKQLKSSQLLSGSVNLGPQDRAPVRIKRRRVVRTLNKEAAPQEQARRGPRIKHVCRAAAVALGQPRAMVPDDIPRLSALPLHERAGITPSPVADDLGSPSEPESPTYSDQRTPKVRRSGGRYPGDYGPLGLRTRRCGRCKGCLHEDDCGKCINCKDKPKFGGPNTKRQCCVHKKCARIEELKAKRLGYKPIKAHMKRRRSSVSVCHSSNDEGEGRERSSSAPPADEESPSLRKQPRRGVKPRSYCDLLDYDSDLDDMAGSSSAPQGKRRAPPSRSHDFASHDDGGSGVPGDGVRHRRPGQHRGPPPRRRAEKSPLEQTPPSVLAALANGFTQREREPSEPTHKIRVDFKEDCNIQNVWLMGGLSILTSVPVIPQHVCLLCASKGQHQMLYCQVCCEPFHWFCLDAKERPLEENKENWCCRRCKFCYVCGRKNKHSKPLLECERCQNCYHSSCLGPNYPKPSKSKTSWVCMSCIRCKSCDGTPGKSWDTDWNHERGLCSDCSKLYDQGNFCTICFKCYEDNDYDSQMMQCARCNHWVHAKCEGLTDDLYEILSNMPESVVYACGPCSLTKPSSWREALHVELRSGVGKVLACLLTSTLTQHLVKCSKCAGVMNPQVDLDQPACDIHAVGLKFDKGLYTTLKSFHEDVAQVIRKRLEDEVEADDEKPPPPDDQGPTSLARSYYLKLMDEVYSWFNSQDPKVWHSGSGEFPAGMLPNAVLPPSMEHVYAQWRERSDPWTSEGLGFPHEGDGEGLHPSTPSTYKLPGTHSRNMRGFYKSQEKRGYLSSADLDLNWSKQDERQCSLCQKYGDAKPNDAGRLLYLGQNEWAHVNCSLWSAEVYEDNGALMHVHSAVTRGRHMRCERCNQTGATVGCCLSSCQSNYHFMCARARNCVFQNDKKVFCHTHRDLISDKIVTGTGFEVLRRVFVDFEGISLRRKFLTGLEPESINMMIGSLLINRLGVLTELSASQGKLFPVGYQCSRWYWSTVDPRRRCRYTCKVKEVRPPVQEKPMEETPDQGDNRTIVHSPIPHTSQKIDTPEGEMAPPPLPEVPPSTPSPPSKLDTGAGNKAPAYPQTRRPAGGMSRPLPSPESTSKSHPILTIGDLEESRRPRRHCTLSHGSSSRSHVSPTTSSISLRSGESLHSRNCSTLSALSPLGAAENPQTSPPPRRRGRSAPAARASVTATPHATLELFPVSSSPLSLNDSQSSLTLSQFPRPSLLSDISPDSTEVPHDFLATTEPEDTALPPHGDDSSRANGAQMISDQVFPCAPLSVDSGAGVAPVMSSKLELNESGCGTLLVVGGEEVEVSSDGLQDGKGDADKEAAVVRALSLPVTSAREDWGNISSDEDMDNYFGFSRTVISSEAARDPEQALAPPSSGPIPQLDGIDDGAESDVSEATNDGTQNQKNTGQAQNPAPLPPQGDNQGDRLSHSSTPSPSPASGKGQLEAASCSEESITSVKSNSLTFSDVLPENTSPGSLKVDSAQLGSTTAMSDTSPAPVETCQASAEPTLIVELQSLPVEGAESSTPDAAFAEGLTEEILMQEVDPEMVTGTFLVCDPSTDASHSNQEVVPMDAEPAELHKDIFLDPDSGHFVAEDGTVLYLTESMEDEALSASNMNGNQGIVVDSPVQGSMVLEQLPTLSHASSDPLSNRPPVQMSLSSPQPTPITYIRASIDPMLASTATSSSIPSMQNVQATVMPSTEYRQSARAAGLTAMSVSAGSGLTLGTRVNPDSPLPAGTATVTVMSSPSATTHSYQVRTTPTSGPIIFNGFTPAPLQREAPRTQTVSINFGNPKPVLPAPQHVVAQTRPGHTILTVQEVGGSSMDSAPQVLLVNRSGQVFIKNPDSNTFQLPSASSPSYTSISKITGLLQSNALSATPAPASNVTRVPRLVTPVASPRVVFNPVATTQLITYSNKGAVTAGDVLIGRKPEHSLESLASDDKKPRKRGTILNVGPKSALRADSSVWPGVQGRTWLNSVSHSGNAQTIIAQAALAGHQNPIQAGVLSTSQFHVHPVLNRAQTVRSVVIPPGLLVKSGSSSPQPRAQVRIKRVSSLPSRSGTKKAKVDSTEQEPPGGVEDLRRAGSATASKPAGVRMKTPTAKGELDLNKLREDGCNNSENTRPVPWDRLSSVSRGESASSDDEIPPPEQDEESPPSKDQPHLRFEITSEDGFSVEADSIEVAWRAVVEGVQEARAGYRLKQLSFAGMSGARMLGVLHDAVIFLVEQLRGASRCQQHSFRFHQQDNQEEELPINPSGCARSEVHQRKSTFDMFNFLASQHRQLPDIGPYDEEEDEVPLKSTRRATSLELPMAMRFRHLEKTSKEAVGVYRSAIHGRGLFCKRNIDAGEMVIEYSGIVIRAVLTDKREKYYDSKGIGCYMFRIDDFDVVDATMHGNAARFINHSCEPNCYSRVIHVEGQKHIVIFALRKIYRGEELTYDYKFPIEDDSSKLSCNCGARRCRRFLN
ncbi:histone-lysine N-methyltransferase 2B-like isoform X2 [Megalops cyprinoides]|uniref:histone-lysine N-methyltransferase 2B-like isoform X2 n=1 Tax=Megalops cyprinoides TaxID=118141 RepID=UPI001863C550|nr:histone-lysine N-methyltransferase 2B-like isoform X2 [Megalops cyprinoides]